MFHSPGSFRFACPFSSLHFSLSTLRQEPESTVNRETQSVFNLQIYRCHPHSPNGFFIIYPACFPFLCWYYPLFSLMPNWFLSKTIGVEVDPSRRLSHTLLHYYVIRFSVSHEMKTDEGQQDCSERVLHPARHVLLELSDAPDGMRQSVLHVPRHDHLEPVLSNDRLPCSL